MARERITSIFELMKLVHHFLKFAMLTKSCFDSFLGISLLLASWVLITPSLFSCEKYFPEASVTIFTTLSMLCVWQGQSGTFIGVWTKHFISPVVREQVRGDSDTPSSVQSINLTMLLALGLISGVLLLLTELSPFWVLSRPSPLIARIFLTPQLLSSSSS